MSLKNMNFIATHHIDLIICISAYTNTCHFLNAILRLSKAANSSLSQSSQIFRTIAMSTSCPLCITEYDECSRLYIGNEIPFWKASARSTIALTKIRRQQGCIVAHQIFLCNRNIDDVEDETSNRINISWPSPCDIPMTETEPKNNMPFHYYCFMTLFKRLCRREIISSKVNACTKYTTQEPSMSPPMQIRASLNLSEIEDLLDRFLCSSSGMLLAKDRVCSHQHCTEDIAPMVYSFGKSSAPNYIQIVGPQRIGRAGGWTEVCVAARNNEHVHSALPLIAPYSQRKMFRKSDMFKLVGDLYSAVGGNMIASSKVRWFVGRVCSADSGIGVHSIEFREILVAICFQYPLSIIESKISIEGRDECLEVQPISARIAGICKVSQDFDWIQF